MKLTKALLPFWLLLIVGWLSAAQAQQSSTPDSGLRPALVTTVAAVGMTVADMDRSIEFYTNVLSFEKVSDVEVWGTEYEHLQGIFGLRMRVVRLRLGSEALEL